MSRPCSHLPGDHGDPQRCPRLTGHQSGLCPTHLAHQRARTDANRPTPHRRGYDTEHRQASRQARTDGTTCQHPGCTRTDVHRDHRDGNPHNNRPNNIQWLCTSHHNSKTLIYDVQRGSDGRILPSTRTPKPHAPTRIRTTEL